MNCQYCHIPVKVYQNMQGLSSDDVADDVDNIQLSCDHDI